MDEVSVDDNLLACMELNSEFHLSLFARADMPRLFRIIELLWQSSDAYRSVFFNDRASRDRVQREHREIIKACWANDADEIIAMMNTHRSNATADLARILGEMHDSVE